MNLINYDTIPKHICITSPTYKTTKTHLSKSRSEVKQRNKELFIDAEEGMKMEKLIEKYKIEKVTIREILRKERLRRAKIQLSKETKKDLKKYLRGGESDVKRGWSKNVRNWSGLSS